jgi:hypothetical protein
MASEQCRHVFLAAAESLRYYQVLELYRKHTSKLTLIFGSGLDGGLWKLGLSLLAFPKVFAAPPGIKAQAVSTSSSATFEEKREVKANLVCTTTLGPIYANIIIGHKFRRIRRCQRETHGNGSRESLMVTLLLL